MRESALGQDELLRDRKGLILVHLLLLMVRIAVVVHFCRQRQRIPVETVSVQPITVLELALISMIRVALADAKAGVGRLR